MAEVIVEWSLAIAMVSIAAIMVAAAVYIVAILIQEIREA